MTTWNLFRAVLLSTVAVVGVGCVSPSGSTPAEERESIRAMRDDTLRDAYAKWPELEAEVKNAPGYVVFRTGVIKILLAGTAKGYGVLVDNRTGKETYMSHFAIALGPMIDVGTQRSVNIISDVKQLEGIESGGWNFGADAAIGLKLFDVGGGTSTTKIDPGIYTYRLFDSGLAIGGTIFWSKLKHPDDWNSGANQGHPKM